jgi:hypothetical protein
MGKRPVEKKITPGMNQENFIQENFDKRDKKKHR